MSGPQASVPATIQFTKGHGTQNDFVLIADQDAELDLTPALVRALTDRRAGIGGDGVIRVVPSVALEEGRALLAEDPDATWFMDYRNADGSLAEMCGNGVRVFAAFLERLGLADLSVSGIAVGTRAGVRRVRREPNGWYAADLGVWSLPGGAAAAAEGADAEVTVTGLPVARAALRVDVGNPHTVVALADEDELAAADLRTAPAVLPAPQSGTNVELVVPLGEREVEGELMGRLRMRVFERGVGETRSCGTGACAAALAVRAWAGAAGPDVWSVDVPGGQVRVTALPDGHVELAGPAVLLASGVVDVAALLG